MDAIHRVREANRSDGTRGTRVLYRSPGADADADISFVISGESRELDVQHVRSGKQGGEAQLPIVVRDQFLRSAISAGEVTRTTAPRRVPPCTSCTVPIKVPVTSCAAATAGCHAHATARRNVIAPRIVGLRIGWLQSSASRFCGFYSLHEAMKKKMFVGVSALMTPGRPIAGSP